jgi:cytidyltransferase-like protein
MKPVVVVVAGTFDGLHAGHLHLFSFARRKAATLEKKLKRKGVKLQVIIARDSNVLRIKGSRPLHDETERAGLVSSLRQVDGVVLGHPTNFMESLKKIKPDMVVLGYDQAPGMEQRLLESGYKTFARATAYKGHKLKSSKLKKNGFHNSV